ncbi:extracellular solute-binding protein [Paenibacillus donghaensis]|uniref:ABC transporter substrate-binding protein n=1 Tax=Paenibacillus donghaensis TaxID=414771 RepID=A0A2Z2K8H2_9BACL|nr:extracellular solute-binding protein [Paenibacillus donghaensis]ASA21567.1 ABC transporter substrate-binding protein [Paenibacillus donghaensis]
MRTQLTHKIVPLMLSLSMLLVAGCGSNTPNAEGSEGAAGEGNSGTGAVKVEVFKSHMGIGSMPAADDPHVKYIADQTGVQYELITTPPGSEPSEYLNLMIASDDLPDILRPIGGVEQTLIQQGGALPLDELLPEYAPHVWESIPQEAWDIVRSASPDGKIYYVPKVFLVPERAPLIRKDWLDKVGMEMPKTKDEYVELLKAFRDKDPNGNGKADELPTSGREFGRWMDHLFAIYGVAMWEGYPEWDEYDGKIQYAGTTANMREAIKFIRMLYEEKLLDNETFLNKGEVWQAKINNNLVGSWYHLPANVRDRYNAMLTQAPDAYIAAMPLPKAEGFDAFVTQKSMGEPEWMIPAAKQDNASNALKLLDFFYNPENDEFVRFGLEGEQHEVKDGRKVIIPPADNKPLALGMKNLTTTDDMNKRIEETYPENQQQMVKDMFTVSTADARQIAGDGLPASVYEGYPDIQSHKLFQEVLTKIVIGEQPLEAYDEYVKKWNASGGEEVTHRVQEWYEKVKK